MFYVFFNKKHTQKKDKSEKRRPGVKGLMIDTTYEKKERKKQFSAFIWGTYISLFGPRRFIIVTMVFNRTIVTIIVLNLVKAHALTALHPKPARKPPGLCRVGAVTFKSLARSLKSHFGKLHSLDSLKLSMRY